MQTTLRQPLTITAADCRTPYAVNLLTAGHTVRTSKGFAHYGATYAARPYACTPHVGLTTWHASPAIALACLASL